MRGFVDLHCHFVPAVDDGVKTADDAVALLRGLRAVGFDHVVATPHIRPALFDNTPARLRHAYDDLVARLADEPALPATSLAAEHFFDDAVFGLLVRREGLGYGEKKRAVLVEFAYEQLPVMIAARFFDLRRTLQRPVVAHPERYEAFVRKPKEAAEAMRRAGGVLLLDLMTLEGRYGSRAQRTAEALLDVGAYYAACSDAHRPEDAEVVGRAIGALERAVSKDEAERLLRRGPRDILEARILDAFD